MSRKKDRFAFWPSDWLGGTASMTTAERGVYIDLLCCQWSEGPLTEAQALAAGRAEAEIVRQVLVKKFHQNPDGTWQNNRLEQERQRIGRDKPKKAPRIDSGERLLPIGDLGQETGITLYKPAEEAVLVFSCRGEPSQWALTAERVENWGKLYPGLDVLAECRKALAWTEAHPKKTAGGMSRFLVTWLNRATNSGSGRNRPEQKSFRQIDSDSKRRLLVKLRLEETGLNSADAERLSNLDEVSALTEAKRLLGLQTPVIAQEEIPW